MENQKSENHGGKLIEEVWKVIPTYSRYQVSNLGRVRTTPFIGTRNRKCGGHLIKLNPDGAGYLRFNGINNEGISKSVRVHKYVAEIFHLKLPGFDHVNHIDGDKTNNTVTNLEFTNNSLNIRHAYRLGLIKPRKGELNGRSKLTEEEVYFIKYILKNSGLSQNKLAEEFKVDKKIIYNILNNKSWKHI